MTEQDWTNRTWKGVKVEPSADHRAAAKTLYAMFTALVDEGFSEDQSLTLVGDLLVAVVTGNDGTGND